MAYGLTDAVVEKIRGVFASVDEIAEVVLYGSRAKGTHCRGSDVDMVLKGEGLNQVYLNRVARELDDLLLPYTFDLSLFREIENPDLIDHIERVGVVFYRRGVG